VADLTLWLLRHAKTVTDPPKGGSDFDRVLAPRGRRDATALATLLAGDRQTDGLADLALPQVALVSPAARTAATAELALAGLSQPPHVQFVPDLYGAEPNDVLGHLRTLDAGLTTVMVVGHNPTMHALSQGLISGDDPDGHALAVRRGFPTCALGVYRFTVTQWADVGAQSATLAALVIPPFGPSKKG
jgi:phosphohistidine phosphatase